MSWDTMRAMRTFVLLCTSVLLFGCARSMESAARTPDAATVLERDASTAEATPVGTPRAERSAGAECRTDADCALTRVPEEGCCQTLCQPRAVTAAEARTLEKKTLGCEQGGKACPDPVCAPPHVQPEPMCSAGHCAVRNVRLDTR
jgi:hypothetical protein